MRYVCCIIVVMMLLTCVVGCATLTTRSYSLGPKPRTALVIIDQIATEQFARHGKEIMRDNPVTAKMTIYKVIEEEKSVVVRTTHEGHRQIKAALQDIQK